MYITIYIAPLSEGRELAKLLLESEFNISTTISSSIIRDEIVPHLNRLKDSCFLLAETPYVDKVYRDSYYHYYSSKQNKYTRDCIKVSIFEGEVSKEDFKDKKKIENLKKQYRGFIVLRPTDPYVIGRNVISPKALRDNSFVSCFTNFNTTVNGVKVEVQGFPHSSQDTETITCAETTLWAIMEYFSTKYAEYRPASPSKIIQTLNNISAERQIPSKGLNVQQMSFALKEFGFGTRIYSKEAYENDFEKILSCYVESGIPIIVAIDNRPKGNIGHAIICVGHEKITERSIDEIPLISAGSVTNQVMSKLASKRIKLYDYDDIKKQFVFIDDNLPVYQAAFLDQPANHYTKEWHDCKIKYFIVPLYQRIYLEAYEAKNFIFKFLLLGPVPINDDQELVIRFYLSSSRSYKDNLLTNDGFQENVKRFILSSALPKFIWVAELTNKVLIKGKEANGLIILDATEANVNNNKPLLFAVYEGNMIELNKTTGKLEKNALPLNNFPIYENNLKVV